MYDRGGRREGGREKVYPLLVGGGIGEMRAESWGGGGGHGLSLPLAEEPWSHQEVPWAACWSSGTTHTTLPRAVAAAGSSSLCR